MSSNQTDDNNSKGKWVPVDILEAKILVNYAIIILNTEILIDPDIVKDLWNKAKVRITVDGGTNRWKYFLENYCQNDDMAQPDYITGDFDSVTKESLEYFYNSLNVHTPNQNETDFTKSLKVLKDEKIDVQNIVVLQENRGRFDHIMANINTLFKAEDMFTATKIFLLSSNAITWLLTPGKHSIDIPPILVAEQRWCCLIPIGKPCNVTTDGLKWNLENSVTEFGAMVSTSNTYATNNVEITTDGYILWSMGVYDFQE